jgi:uncharacterized protein involved in exopolysaccharide biosynthesis/Mrp family chromosome partitioning ATPase
MVRPGMRETVTPEMALAGGMEGRYVALRDAVLAEMQLLINPRLYDKAARRIGPEKLLEAYDPTRGYAGDKSLPQRVLHRFQKWWFQPSEAVALATPEQVTTLAASVLSVGLQFYPDPAAGTILVSYQTVSPAGAQMVVDGVLEAALEFHAEVFETSRSLDVLTKELQRAEEAARKSEEALALYKTSKGIYAFEAQRDALLVYLERLESEVENEKIEERRLEAVQAQLTEVLKNLPDSDRNARTRMLNPEYSSLRAQVRQLQLELVRLESERISMNVSRDQYEQQRKRVEDFLQECRTQLEKEPMFLDVDATGEAETRESRLRREFDTAETQLAGVRLARAQRAEVRDSVRTRLATFETASAELGKLELEAQQNRAQADRMAASAASLQTIQRLDNLKLSNLQVLFPATQSQGKIGPNRSMLLVGGVVGGLAAGFFLAFVLGLVDRRVRSVLDLERRGIKVCGVIGGPVRNASQMAADLLPSELLLPFGDVREDIAELWSSLPFDRRSSLGLRIACVPDASSADGSRVAGCLATGLALHGGEKVCLVSCSPGGGWLSERLGIPGGNGWMQVLDGKARLGDCVCTTQVPGLSFLPLGLDHQPTPHPMRRHEFGALLQELCNSFQFVVVELPVLTEQPEGRAVLRVVDGVLAVVALDHSTHRGLAAVRGDAQAAGAQFVGAAVIRDRELRAASGSAR